MLRIFLLILYVAAASSHPAACTEDSQCPSGYYCEEAAHYCRECLRCEDFKREPPQPPVVCVKSIVECGACFKGLIANIAAGKDRPSGDCVTREAQEAPLAYLPAYAWAAIATGLLLSAATIGVFLKMKAYNVTSYSSHTSVQAADVAAACQPPPPYNLALPSLALLNVPQAEAPEIQRLMDSPQSCRKPASDRPAEHPRESSSSQAARVYNHPAYVRVPQSFTRCNSPEGLVSPPEVNDHDVSVSPTFDVPSYVSERDAKQADLSDTSRRKDQDTNNNRPSPEECYQGSPSAEGSDHAPSRDAYVIAGPSFVINVVENINNVRQRNEATFCTT